MSNSVRSHRRQPTRLPRPWDSPGKNTGVGCHFLLQCMKMKSESEVAQSCLTLATPWIAAYQAPPSMGFSRQKYWNGVPLPSPTQHIYEDLNLEMRGNGWMMLPWIKVGSCRKQQGLEENITYWLGNVKSQVPLRYERRMSTWLLGISPRAQ